MVQTVFLQLLGQQVFLCDVELLIGGIAGHLDDLHTVQQRAGDIPGGVGRGDEKHLGKIDGDLHIVIAEMAVLFTVQHLKKSGGGISLIIAAHLVDLIQQHERILHARLLQTGHDPSRHGAHVGPSVAADLRLVPHASQADAHIFLVQRLRNAAGDGGFAGSGRSYQTDDGTVSLLRQAPDRQKFQNPLLDLLQSVMIPLQNILRTLQIRVVLRRLIPGKLQQGLKIASFHGSLRASLSQALKSADLPADLILHLPGGFQLLQFGKELLRIGADGVLSQLLPDVVHLLPQHVVALILIHPRLDLLRQLRPDLRHPDLLVQDARQHLIAAVQIHRLQHGLLLFVIHRHAFDHFIHQPSQTEPPFNAPLHRLAHSREIGGEFQKQLL